MEQVDHHAQCKARKLHPKIVRETLVAAFPKCFKAKGQKKLPLAIGIFKEIKVRLPELSNSELRDALSDYTNGPKYLGEMVEGATRVDLDGWNVDVVTADQAAYAKQRLDYLLKRWELKKVAKVMKRRQGAFKKLAG